MPFLPLCYKGILSKKGLSRSPGLECSYGKFFIPITKISVARSEIWVTGAAGFSFEEIEFFQRREKWGEISKTEPARLTWLFWRGSSSNTCESESDKAMDMQSRLGIIYLLIFHHYFRKYMGFPFPRSTNKHFTHGKMMMAYHRNRHALQAESSNIIVVIVTA